MKLLVLLVLVVLVVAVVVVLLNRPATKDWELVERAEDEHVALYCARGREELLVGRVPFAAEDFDYEIEELRATGRQRLIALGGPRGPRRSLGS